MSRGCDHKTLCAFVRTFWYTCSFDYKYVQSIKRAPPSSIASVRRQPPREQRERLSQVLDRRRHVLEPERGHRELGVLLRLRDGDATPMPSADPPAGDARAATASRRSRTTYRRASPRVRPRRLALAVAPPPAPGAPEGKWSGSAGGAEGGVYAAGGGGVGISMPSASPSSPLLTAFAPRRARPRLRFRHIRRLRFSGRGRRGSCPRVRTR